MPTFIILGIIFQIFTYNETAWGNTLKECTRSSISNNMFQNDLYQQDTKLYVHDHIHHALNFYPYTINKLRVHAYNYHSPFFSTYTSKIQLQNDSINMFHSFHTQRKKNKKNLSFMQLGIHNLLSEQIFNFGGGKRHLINDKYAIGYNTFFHCPISNQNDQPYSINIGVEYWFYNMLLRFNNYYNLNNTFYPETGLQKCHIYSPKSGHQLYIQSQLPHFFEFTGKIKLEQFIYDKKYKKFFDKKNSDYYLSLDLNYQPIPILGLSINNIFVNKQYINTVYQISIDYQFGIPITEQINYINKKNKTILNNLDTIMQPFIPTVMQQYRDEISLKEHNPCSSLRYTKKIIGYPGEIKIITINNNNDKPVQWDFELFENHGGNIVAITNNTYALYFPKYPIKEEDNIFISYIANHAKKRLKEHKKQNIHIVVKDFSQKKLSNANTRKYNADIININNDSGINVTENTTEHTLIYHDSDQHRIKDIMPTSNVVTQNDCDIYNNTLTLTKNTQKPTTQDDCTCLVPPPPPIPFSFLKKNSSSFIASSTLNDTSLLSPFMSVADQQTHSKKNSDNEETYGALSKYSKIELDCNDDLSHRLSIHRQSKFASVGTEEHINKLESTVKKRKDTKHLSDIEKRFVKLSVTQSSSSSVSEDYATDDSNDDSFNFTNKM